MNKEVRNEEKIDVREDNSQYDGEYEKYVKGFTELGFGNNPMTKEQWEVKRNQKIPQTCFTCKHKIDFQSRCPKSNGCLGVTGRQYWEHDGRTESEYPDWVMKQK